MFLFSIIQLLSLVISSTFNNDKKKLSNSCYNLYRQVHTQGRFLVVFSAKDFLLVIEAWNACPDEYIGKSNNPKLIHMNHKVDANVLVLLLL